jgi:hypothetical protein
MQRTHRRTRMAAACDEIWDAIVQARSERSERLRLERLMRWTDRLLDELERLNLSEVPRLSASWRASLAPLFSSLPFEFKPIITASPTPTEVLDVVFDLQQLILSLKTSSTFQELGDEEVAGPRSIAS